MPPLHFGSHLGLRLGLDFVVKKVGVVPTLGTNHLTFRILSLKLSLGKNCGLGNL